MKFNKELAIILVLMSFLVTSISVAFYFYKKNETIVQNKKEMISLYVAREDIPRNTLIRTEHLKKTEIAREFILNKPLLQKEIIGKYAKENIFLNEIFIQKKLSREINLTENEILPAFKHNSYNMAFNLFENPNYSLKPEDHVKIISVYKKFQKTKTEQFNVQYVAKNLRIIGFLRDGHTTSKSIVKMKVKKVIKQQRVDEIVDVKAEELILDIPDDILLKLIDDYNKGKQLWVVKTNKKIKPKKVVKKRTYKKKIYRLQWYKSRRNTHTRQAVIEYKNNPELRKTKKAKIVEDYQDECSQKKQLLLGISKNVNLRAAPTFKSKVKRIVHRYYIIPYTNIIENKKWYRTCDGLYVHKNEVKKETLKGLNKYKKKSNK